LQAEALLGVVPDVSVIVPTWNGERTVRDCLTSVLAALDGLRGELIVVDSGTDGTAELVRREFPAVRLIRSEERLTAGAARNRGIEASRGRLVCFTDQDCVVPPDWVQRLSRIIADGSLDGAGGSVAIRNVWSASGCALYFLEFLNQFPTRARPERNPLFLVGCNSIYRRDVLERVRFPDLTISEDVLFAHELYGAGYVTEYHPEVPVLHENRRGWKTFFAYNRKMGEAAAAYHAILRMDWAMPFLHAPILSFAAPLAVLPSIGLELLRWRRDYFWRFMLLLPMCLLGNLVWATGFRRRALALQSRLREEGGSAARSCTGERVRSGGAAPRRHAQSEVAFFPDGSGEGKAGPRSS
jgi:glycosyltransferase involved in cell wall biosynthesis